MPVEENTADEFPDKGEFITPGNKRKKPDCDRKTLIPDPCDLRVDRRKKTDGNNDCESEPIIQVCPEDLGKFQIPEMPKIPEVFLPKRKEPIVLKPIENIPAPDAICNDGFTVSCPSPGWLDADWVRENILSGSGEDGLQIEEDEFGGVSDILGSGIDLSLLPDDPEIFIPPGDVDKEFGKEVVVPECVFVAETKKEANKRARIHALRSLDCQYCNPDLKFDCSDYQALALPIGGVGYTAENTSIVITGDGSGAVAVPVIDANTGNITGITISEGGEAYTAVTAEIEGDGVGGAIGLVVIDDPEGCGGPITSMSIGQTLPDPNYDYDLDPPIYSSQKPACLPKCTVTSSISVEDAIEQAKARALNSLDCSYQSPEIYKECPDGQIPKTGFTMPLGAFKTPIQSGTQAGVTAQSQEIIDALVCISIPCPDGFPEAIVDIEILDPNEGCDDEANGGGNGSWFDANFDEANCAYKLEGLLELPEIPCQCGFTTNSEISGMDVVGGEEGNAVLNNSSECSGAIDLGINVDGNVEVDFNFDLNTCTFDLDIDLPNIEMECTSIGMDVSGGNFSATINESDEFGVDVLTVGNACVTGNGCSLQLEIPSYELELNIPQINIPCPDGFETDISGGCMVVNHPPRDICSESNVGINNEPCLSEGRANLESEGWSFEGATDPDHYAPTGMNPPVCINVGETVEFDIPPYSNGSDTPMYLGDHFVISDPECNPADDCDPATSDLPCCDNPITGGGHQTTVDHGDVWEDGSVKLNTLNVGQSNNALEVTRSGFTIEDGGTFTWTAPDIGDANKKAFYYHSEHNPVGMVGEIQVVAPGETCEISGADRLEGQGCGGDCSKSGESGGGGSATMSFDLDNCAFDIQLPNYKIDIPEVPCACGFQTQANVSGGGLEVSSTEPTAAPACGAALNIAPVITQDGSTEVNLSYEDCEFVVNLGIPNLVVDIPCDTITTTVSGGEIEVSVAGDDQGFDLVPTKTSEACVVETSECGLEIELPNFSLDLVVPAIPALSCANGFSTNSELDISVVNVGHGEAFEPGGDFDLIYDANTCTFHANLDFELPSYEFICGGGYSAANADIQIIEDIVQVGEGLELSKTGTASSNIVVSVDPNTCGIGVEGAIELPTYYISAPNLNVPCPNIGAGGEIIISGGQFCDANGDCQEPNGSMEVSYDSDTCSLNVTCDLELPNIDLSDINVPCPTVASGNVNVLVTSQDGSTSDGGSITLLQDGCNITLDGDVNIDLPNIDIGNVNVECAEGYTVGGSANVVVNNPDGTTSDGGYISLSGEGCNITLDGDISIDIPNTVTTNIECSEIEGAICEDDYTETTLSVCDSDGQTSSITVLVKN